jgi:HlyD family secretion protein
VRLIEPSSFTKVSALGVEEQRVNVIVDFTDPPDCWKLLGDRFAVEVRIVVWQAAAAIKVPVGALFRRGDAWAVYTASGGRAIERPVRIAARNDREAAVDDGLSDGDLVVVHPSDKISNRTRISVR